MRNTIMKLQDRLIQLAEYGIGFNVNDGNFLVNITYKDGWSVIKPSDETILFIADQKRPNTYYYSAPITTDITCIFDAINDTVTYNKDIEEKVRIFKERVEELQELFAELPLSSVKKLVFTVPDEQAVDKKQPKRKTSAKKQTRKTKEKTSKKADTGTSTETETTQTEGQNNEVDIMIETAMKEKEQEVWQQ